MAIERPLNRRRLLAGLGGAALGACVPIPTAWGRAAGLIAGCARGTDGKDRAVLCAGDGRLLLATPLPDRGHCPAVSPDGRWAIFPARRPGRFAAVVDVAGRRLAGWLESPPGRHFYGHAAFLADGRTVATTENDYEAGRGVLGLWDLETRAHLGDVSSGGVGPHQILAMPDRRAVIVANGGLRTHPSTGREKLNIPTMRPNLARIALPSGAVTARAEAPDALRKISLRHFDLSSDGTTILVGGQNQGPVHEHPPLIALWQLDGEDGALVYPDLPLADLRALNGYVGSVALDATGRIAAVTAPRGDTALILDLAAPGRPLARLRLPDVCGAARAGTRRLVLSTGTGRLSRVTVSEDGAVATDPLDAPPALAAWDNHLTAG